MKTSKIIMTVMLLAVMSNVSATTNNITASQYVSMYINKTNREVFVMGMNYKGLLGQYSPDISENYTSYLPVPTGILNAKSVIATAIKSYVLTNSGNVYVWGFDYVTRKSVSRPILMPYKNVIDMAGTASQAAFIIDPDGDGKGALVTTDFAKETQYPELQDAVQVSGGWDFFTVLKANGDVYTIGSNAKGQLGVGDKLAHAGANRVPLLTNDVITISNGNYHVAVLHVDGTVSTWGDNTDNSVQGANGNTWYNKLGYGTPTNIYLPKKVPGLSNIIELSAGFSGTFALDSNGVVWATGFHNFIGTNYLGQSLYTGALKPVPIVNNISDLTVGHDVNFITDKFGVVKLWGTNRGKTGTGTANPGEYHTIATMGAPINVANYAVIANDAPVVTTPVVTVNPIVVTPGVTVLPIPDTSVVNPVTTVPNGSVIPVTVVTTETNPTVPVPVTSVPVGTVVTPVVTVVPPVVNHEDDNVLTTECKNGYGYGDTNHCHIKEDKIDKENGHS